MNDNFKEALSEVGVDVSTLVPISDAINGLGLTYKRWSGDGIYVDLFPELHGEIIIQIYTNDKLLLLKDIK